MVWFSLRVREVTGSIPVQAQVKLRKISSLKMYFSWAYKFYLSTKFYVPKKFGSQNGEACPSALRSTAEREKRILDGKSERKAFLDGFDRFPCKPNCGGREVLLLTLFQTGKKLLRTACSDFVCQNGFSVAKSERRTPLNYRTINFSVNRRTG